MLEYKTDLFESETITRMADHFKTLLEEIVTGPDQRISNLQILSQDELRCIEQWSGAHT
jgi:non-ribosomal peptide synthetase component F